MAPLRFPTVRLPAIRLPSQGQVVRAVQAPFNQAGSYLRGADLTIRARLPNAPTAGQAIAFLNPISGVPGAPRFSPYSPAGIGLGIAGGASFFVTGPEEIGAKGAAEASPWVARGLEAAPDVARGVERAAPPVLDAGVRSAEAIRPGAAAADVVKGVTASGKSWYQALRPSLQFAGKAAVYGGAVAGGGIAAGVGLTALGQGAYNLGTGVGGGLSNLLGISSGGGGSAGSSGGGGSSGSTGGPLDAILSSPLLLLVIVGVGAYVVVSHERRKGSSPAK